jgi:hemolysin III
MASVRPATRGLSHRVAALVAWPAAVVAVLTVPPAARLGVGVFAVCIALMFTASAVVHARRWSPQVTEALFRLDHTAIFLAIAGTATPLGLLVLEGWQRSVMLWGVWVGAVLGIAVVWYPRRTPRGFATTVFLSMSWLTVLLLPAVHARTGWDTTALLLGGGLLYTVGAVIVAIRRPDPRPHLFGYHEIWHLLVIGAVVLHYVMILATVVPRAVSA